MITFLDFLSEAVVSTKSIASKQDVQNINAAYKDAIKLKAALDALSTSFDRRYNKYVAGSDEAIVAGISELNNLLTDAYSSSEKLLKALSKATVILEKSASTTSAKAPQPDKTFWDEYNKVLKFLSDKKHQELIWNDLKPKEFGDYINAVEKGMLAFEKKYASILSSSDMKNSWTAQKADILKELERQKVDVEPLKALLKAVKIGDKVEKVIPNVAKILRIYPNYFKQESEDSLRAMYEKRGGLVVGSGRTVLISFNDAGKVSLIA